jgi:hypothetical protein
LLKENLRVGYYLPKTLKGGGIERYIKCITNIDSQLPLDFVNLGDKNIFSNKIVHHFLFVLFLFIPFLNIYNKTVDIFWGHAHKLPLFKVKGISYVVTIHDLAWKVCPHTMPLKRRITEWFFFPIAIRNADKIMVVSQSLLM